MKHLRSIAAIFGFLCMFFSVTAQADDKRLMVTGSSTIAPLVLEVAKRFETQNSGVRIDVQTGGSSRGVSDARNGVADIGLVSRALKSDESDLVGYKVAMDGVCMIVHKSNPIVSLSANQIREIYTGKIKNWKEVGGPDQSITVVNKAEGRSTLELFLGYFKLENRAIRAHAVIGDNQQGIKTVSANPGAIGYVSVGTAEFEAKHGTPIRLLPLEGVEASVANVGNGTFPMSRPLNLVTRGETTGITQQFIEYTQSDNVHDLVEAQFFVPVGR